MTTRQTNAALVIFPGALGDFVCFLPTLLALHARHGSLSVVAKPSLLDLLPRPHMHALSIDRREIADLFGDGELAQATRARFAGHTHTYSWSGWQSPQLPQRLAAATGGTVDLFPFHGMYPGEHAADYYARCVGAQVLPIARGVLPSDMAWLRAFRREHQLEQQPYLVVHPGSGSRAKNWTGFGELVEVCRQNHSDVIVVIHGPVEAEHRSMHIDGLVVESPSMPQLVALLSGARLYAGNDSGVSHLAAAVGARGVVLFGASDPATWSPRGGNLRILHAPALCAACGTDVFCTHRLPVGSVAAVLLDTKLTA